MRVILIAHTYQVNTIPGYKLYAPFDDVPHDMDELSEQAGRLCYESWNRPNPKTSKNAGYLANIIDHGHFSVLEHSSVTFYFDGITRNLTHEFIRHRHLSYSEVSQRYVDAGGFPFVTHPGLADLSEDTRRSLNKAITAGREAYLDIIDEMSDKGIERKQARQAARHALVSGTETKILVTGNLRAWRDMLQKRLSPTADAEFQEVARGILSALKLVAPNSFQDMDLS